MANKEDTIVKIIPKFSVPTNILDQFTVMEVNLTESLTTPGLQTSVRVHSKVHGTQRKDFDKFKGTFVNIYFDRPILAKYGIRTDFDISQQIYRLENRGFINNNVEELFLHACDPTLLTDAATLVSKLWKCTTPSAVVSDVLTACIGVAGPKLDVEPSCCPRDYQAENIHPFQVVAQQANAALAAGDDPSFMHYMTYENYGTHKFRSLYSLCRQNFVMEYYFMETGAITGFDDPHAILTHNFPCDFDLLSDIQNGLGPTGAAFNTFASFNPLARMVNIFGNQGIGCGVGGAILSHAMSNMATAQQQNACPDYSQLYILKRQARMHLLDPDKIVVRVTVPWIPGTILNAGKIIRLSLYNKETNTLLYGSGDYLIVNITHTIKWDSMSTITMDCITKSVGAGGIIDHTPV